jgi:large subunit ribosomal protein L18
MAKMNRTEARQKRHRRVRKNISGTAQVPRLSVFRSLNEIYAQIIDDQAGVTIVASSSIDKQLRDGLIKQTKIEQAKQVGKLVAERAQQKGVKQVVFDRGGFRYFGRVKALAEAAREAGLQF